MKLPRGFATFIRSDIRLLSIALGGVILWVSLALSQPLSIQEAVERARLTAPQCRRAEAVIQEARGEQNEDLSLRSPEFSIRWDNIPVGSEMTALKERRLGISQRFLFPDKYRWLNKTTQANIRLAEAQARIIRMDAEYSVKESFLLAWSLTEKARILREWRDELDSLSFHIQQQAERGQISSLDARRCAAELMEAETDCQAAEAQAEAAMRNLHLLLNDFQSEWALISPLEGDPPANWQLEEADSGAANPEVFMLGCQADAARMERDLAQRSWLPDFQVSYYYRDQVGRDRSDNWALEVEATVPLWRWWGGAGEIQAADARMRQASAEQAEARLAALTERNQLFGALRAVRSQVKFYRETLIPLAKDEFVAAKRALELGAGDYLDLVKARTRLKRTQRELLDRETEMCEIRIRLQYLDGIQD